MHFPQETIKKISKNKNFLERKLKIKIEIKEDNIKLKGNELDIYAGEKVLEAMDKNFPVKTALLLVDESYILEGIPIKSIREKNLKETKARIIGSKGKTLKTLCELSECFITLHNNTVSIIGEADKIKIAVIAVKSLIRGSKQSNVYYYLESHRQEEIDDLGLKE